MRESRPERLACLLGEGSRDREVNEEKQHQR
jgi:hypothetical protein